jgi:hypothetical protein
VVSPLQNSSAKSAIWLATLLSENKTKITGTTTISFRKQTQHYKLNRIRKTCFSSLITLFITRRRVTWSLLEEKATSTSSKDGEGGLFSIRNSGVGKKKVTGGFDFRCRLPFNAQIFYISYNHEGLFKDRLTYRHVRGPGFPDSKRGCRIS